MKREIRAVLIAVSATATIGVVTPALAENAADAARDAPFSAQQDASAGSTAIVSSDKRQDSQLIKLLEPNGPFAQ